jgi:hypothetical protein
VPVNSTHPDYEANLPTWLRARDVLAGEDAVKSGGEKYLPRLDSQTPDEFSAYKSRASFFNATARTAEGFVGLIFRRPPVIKLPENNSGVGRALKDFQNDVDMLGTGLPAYAQNVVGEVISVGRGGTLLDWEEVEQRVNAVFYTAEQIINWRVDRVNGRNLPTLIVLREDGDQKTKGDDFVEETVERLRVLRLVPLAGESEKKQAFALQVEIWEVRDKKGKKQEWVKTETRTPLRLGKPLPQIPFVFHGPRHSLPQVDKLPLGDIIAVNLDHYRLDADFKHGLHFTALPTAWVSGFDKGSTLRIGSSTAWVTEVVGATAGFLEFKGQGLETFERAQDRDERLMAVLGSRLLEPQKRVGETADAIELRQSGENNVLSTISTSVSESLTQMLQWVHWWNSTEELPDSVGREIVSVELNTDFSIRGLSSDELKAVVLAWQAGAISRDTMFDLFRKGEVLPEGRTNEKEAALIKESAKEQPTQPEVK